MTLKFTVHVVQLFDIKSGVISIKHSSDIFYVPVTATILCNDSINNSESLLCTCIGLGPLSCVDNCWIVTGVVLGSLLIMIFFTTVRLVRRLIQNSRIR